MAKKMESAHTDHYTKDYCGYKSIIENGGSVELADKWLAYQNAGIDAQNALWDKITTHKTMGELFDLINEKTGLNLHYSFEIKGDAYGRPYVSYESVENLVDGNPILGLAWKEMHINNFNGGSVWREEHGIPGAEKFYSSYDAKDIDYTKPMTVGFNIDLHYSYEHISGGSNGARIGWARYDGEKWTVDLDKDSERYNRF